jgi:hypothetical protein
VFVYIPFVFIFLCIVNIAIARPEDRLPKNTANTNPAYVQQQTDIHKRKHPHAGNVTLVTPRLFLKGNLYNKNQCGVSLSLIAITTPHSMYVYDVLNIKYLPLVEH